MSSSSRSALSWQPEFQALRGIAVLLVVLYHARIPGFSGGYLGVDVFFVLSGFLITRLIILDLDAGRFSFVHFYWRRSRRLLPAAFTVIAVCLAVQPWFLAPEEQRGFYESVIYSVGFLANVGFWLQSGYFQPSAELKPLLHFWSLAVEEQFYFLLPVFLLLSRRWHPSLPVILMTGASLILCLITIQDKPGATFYLLPTRAWELGLGATLAVTSADRRVVTLMSSGWRRLATASSVLLLSYCVLQPVSALHPFIDAIFVCLATAVLICSPPTLLSQGMLARLLVWIGDRSYSIYLVHWPVLAFAANANVSSGGYPWPVRLALAAVGVLLGWLLYATIETRFRVKPGSVPRYRRDLVALLVSALLLLSLASLGLAKQGDEEGYAWRLRANVGLSTRCAGESSSVDVGGCSSSASAKTVVWGDSYAMHWVQGLVEHGLDVIQITKPTCAPIVGVALTGGKYSKAWSSSCIDFNDSALNAIRQTSATTVVLASQWGYLTHGNLLVRSSQGLTVMTDGVDALERRIVETIENLRQSGKKVVLLMPPPHGGLDRGRCVLRHELGLISFGAPDHCIVSSIDAEKALAPTKALLSRVGAAAKVAVIDPWGHICDERGCVSKAGDKVIYRDGGHLSYEGSRWLVQEMGLVDRIRKEAR